MKNIILFSILLVWAVFLSCQKQSNPSKTTTHYSNQEILKSDWRVTNIRVYEEKGINHIFTNAYNPYQSEDLSKIAALNTLTPENQGRRFMARSSAWTPVYDDLLWVAILNRKYGIALYYTGCDGGNPETEEKENKLIHTFYAPKNVFEEAKKLANQMRKNAFLYVDENKKKEVLETFDKKPVMFGREYIEKEEEENYHYLDSKCFTPCLPPLDSLQKDIFLALLQTEQDYYPDSLKTNKNVILGQFRLDFKCKINLNNQLEAMPYSVISVLDTINEQSKKRIMIENYLKDVIGKNLYKSSEKFEAGSVRNRKVPTIFYFYFTVLIKMERKKSG